MVSNLTVNCSMGVPMGFSFGGILRATHITQGPLSEDSEDTSPLSRRSLLFGKRAEQICIDSYFDTRCCFSSIVSSLSSGGFTKKRQLKVRFLWGCCSFVQPKLHVKFIVIRYRKLHYYRYYYYYYRKISDFQLFQKNKKM